MHCDVIYEPEGNFLRAYESADMPYDGNLESLILSCEPAAATIDPAMAGHLPFSVQSGATGRIAVCDITGCIPLDQFLQGATDELSFCRVIDQIHAFITRGHARCLNLTVWDVRFVYVSTATHALQFAVVPFNGEVSNMSKLVSFLEAIAELAKKSAIAQTQSVIRFTYLLNEVDLANFGQIISVLEDVIKLGCNMSATGDAVSFANMLDQLAADANATDKATRGKHTTSSFSAATTLLEDACQDPEDLTPTVNLAATGTAADAAKGAAGQGVVAASLDTDVLPELQEIDAGPGTTVLCMDDWDLYGFEPAPTDPAPAVNTEGEAVSAHTGEQSILTSDEQCLQAISVGEQLAATEDDSPTGIPDEAPISAELAAQTVAGDAAGVEMCCNGAQNAGDALSDAAGAQIDAAPSVASLEKAMSPILPSAAPSPTLKLVCNRPGAGIAHVDTSGAPGRPTDEFLLEPGVSFTIGKSKYSNFQIINNTVSRTHVTLCVRLDGSCEVTDRGSYNSTFLNGQKLEAFAPYTAHAGDRLRLSDEEFTLVANS